MTLASHGLLSFINEPTRVTGNSNTCVNHVFFRKKVNTNLDLNCFLIDSFITDHKMTAACVKCAPEEPSATNETSTKPLNLEKLSNLLRGINWSDVYKSSDVSMGFNLFLSKVNSCME